MRDYNYSIIKWYRKNWIDRENVENDVKQINYTYDLLLVTQQNVGWAKIVDNKS